LERSFVGGCIRQFIALQGVDRAVEPLSAEGLSRVGPVPLPASSVGR
jgi:hypothetical protein